MTMTSIHIPSRPRRALVFIAALVGLTCAAPALAQTDIPPPPAFQTTDPFGVSLLEGTVQVTSPSISVGPAEGGLSYTATWDGTARAWRSSIWGGIDKPTGSDPYCYRYLTVTMMGQSSTFQRDTCSGGYELKDGTGTLSRTGDIWTYTAPDGTVATYDYTMRTGLGAKFSANQGLITTITKPNGEVISYTYSSSQPRSVTNNLGYQLHLEYGTDGVSKVTALNNAVDACAPTAATCSYSRTWPSLTFTTSGVERRVTDSLNRTTRIIFDGTNVVTAKIVGVARPTKTTGASVTYGYSQSQAFGWRVSSASDGVGTWTYDYESWTCPPLPQPCPPPTDHDFDLDTTITDPNDGETVYKFFWSYPAFSEGQVLKELIAITNPLDQTTWVDIDAAGFNMAQYPEGNRLTYQRDALTGVLETVTEAPKPGSGLTNTVTALGYPACTSNPIVCRRPTTRTDARGNVTDYTYDAAGNLLTETGPAPTSGAVRPQTRHVWQQRYAWYKRNGSSTITQAASPVWVPVETSACTTTASCDGLATEVLTTTTYQAGSASAASNLLPLSVSTGSGDGALTATTTNHWTEESDLLAVDGPLAGTADTTRYIYDAMRQVVGVIGPDPDGAGARLFPATKTTYDADGQPTAVARGTTTGQGLADWPSFSALQTDTTAYDAQGRKVRDTLASGSANPQVTQYSYDDAGLLTCAARRMNPASLPANACALGTEGSFGPDRLSHTTYDLAGRLLEVREGYATPDVRLERKQTYTPNGQIDWVEDGMGNRSDYAYDGFDRLFRLFFPMPTMGAHAANSSDYEQYGYDANDNPTTKRTRAGETFTTTFDALNRITYIDAPSGTSDLSFAYDLLNRRTGASNTTFAIGSTWDALGRELTQTGPLGAMAYQYDLAGRRTRITWPDSVYVTYDWNLDDQMQRIRLSGTSDLISYAYDNLGRRTLATRLNGMTTTSSYNTASQLTGMVNNLSGTTHDLTYGFSYSPAPQIVGRTVSNALHAYTPADGTQAYVNNGRNQTTSAGGATVTWDAKANLTSDGVKSYTYDALNRMLTGGGSTLTYDPLDRLYSMTGTGAGRFQYDGSQLAAVYSPTSLTITERYVAGPNPDEWVAIYSGSGTTSPSYPLQDPQGSVVALTNSSAVATSILAYDEYGVPKSGNVGRMQYTGQMWLPDPGLYHYKARDYLPQLGRFVQTDPVGYEQGMNLYAYVANDPVNKVDPTGMYWDIIVELKGYKQGSIPGYGDFGHAYTQVTDTDTGQSATFRGGPSSEYPASIANALTNRAVEGVNLTTQVDPADVSPDTRLGGFSDQRGGSEVLARTNLGDDISFKEVVSGLEAVSGSLNEAHLPYQPRSLNSNWAAGVAYRTVTGERVDSGQVERIRKYPGIDLTDQ